MEIRKSLRKLLRKLGGDPRPDDSAGSLINKIADEVDGSGGGSTPLFVEFEYTTEGAYPKGSGVGLKSNVLVTDVVDAIDHGRPVYLVYKDNESAAGYAILAFTIRLCGYCYDQNKDGKLMFLWWPNSTQDLDTPSNLYTLDADVNGHMYFDIYVD